MKTLILVLIASFAINACGKKGEQSPDPTVASTDITVSDNGKVVAYFLGFATDNGSSRYQSNANADAFLLLKTGEIVEVDLVSGKYVSDKVAYASSGCSGQAFSMANVLANQVLYVTGSGFFKATGKTQDVTPTSCASETDGCYTQGCSGLHWNGVAMKPVEEPYDFTRLAPIVISENK